jgi:predicted RNA-binding protein with PIN domain
VAGVTVLVSAYGRDADTVIEEIIAQKRATGDGVLLVTSDQALQWTTMGAKVTRMSSAEFGRELAEESADRETYARDGSGTALDSRLDPDTREKLARWARGEGPSKDRS